MYEVELLIIVDTEYHLEAILMHSRTLRQNLVSNMEMSFQRYEFHLTHLVANGTQQQGTKQLLAGKIQKSVQNLKIWRVLDAWKFGQKV